MLPLPLGLQVWTFLTTEKHLKQQYTEGKSLSVYCFLF